MHSALIVFAKVPTPGAVKTRLTPPLETGDAAILYRAFLEDTLQKLAPLGIDIRLYLDRDVGDRAAEEQMTLPSGVPRHEQRGKDLGSRMANAFAETFAAGYGAAVIVGTDHPTLPEAFVELAVASLEQQRTVVVGPADDGGYYLLGMNEFLPELFREMTYSHEHVLEETLDRIGSTGAHLTLLPFWYDVDTVDALLRLGRDLRSDDAAAPRTRAVLKRLEERHAWLLAE